MRNQLLSKLNNYDRLLPINKIKAKQSSFRIYIFTLGNMIVLLLLFVVIMYFKYNYQSINANFNELNQRLNQITSENNQYRQDIIITKDKKNIDYQSALDEIQVLETTIEKYSSDLNKNQMSLTEQKNKIELLHDTMYEEYNNLCAVTVISSTYLNKVYFPFSNFKFTVQGVEYHSNIIKSIEELKFIEEITEYKVDKPCYQSSQSVLMGQLFRNYCKDNKPNVSLYLTDKNNRFGGFTELAWGRDEEKYDWNALLFNLDRKKVWKATPGHETVLRFMGSLPSFGEGDIRCTAGEICTVNKWFKSFTRNNKQWEINGGYESFRVLSVEVFQLVR